MSYPILNLRAGKEANVGFRHPWVFSGALADNQSAKHGECVRVADRNGRIIGTGTYSKTSSIAVRVFAFSDVVIDRAWLKEKILDAQEKRTLMGYGSDAHPWTSSGSTTGYRVVFGEADGIPGLVVDRYADVLVFQLSTAGIDAMRADIIATLNELFEPRAIVERSDALVRREEQLANVVGMCVGEAPGFVEFLEQGRRCIADPLRGQKTGFFLDQKDLRSAIAKLSKGRSVLNLFSYTGASAMAAFAGEAKRVHNVDGSEEALALVAEHARRNGIAADLCTVQKTDIFQWLGQTEGSYDMVIMDPPALIKSAKDAEEGKKAYHFLNRAAMKLVKNGGIFITSSCSRFMPEEDLAFALRRASVQAGVDLQVLEVIRQSSDHPVSVYFPEAAYLKSFVCRVKKVA